MWALCVCVCIWICVCVFSRNLKPRNAHFCPRHLTDNTPSTHTHTYNSVRLPWRRQVSGFVCSVQLLSVMYTRCQATVKLYLPRRIKTLGDRAEPRQAQLLKVLRFQQYFHDSFCVMGSTLKALPVFHLFSFGISVEALI